MTTVIVKLQACQGINYIISCRFLYLFGINRSPWAAVFSKPFLGVFLGVFWGLSGVFRLLFAEGVVVRLKLFGRGDNGPSDWRTERCSCFLCHRNWGPLVIGASRLFKHSFIPVSNLKWAINPHEINLEIVESAAKKTWNNSSHLALVLIKEIVNNYMLSRIDVLQSYLEYKVKRRGFPWKLSGVFQCLRSKFFVFQYIL